MPSTRQRTESPLRRRGPGGDRGGAALPGWAPRAARHRSPMRKTKIIATLGPATDSPEMLGKLLDAGMDIARLNMSHAPHEWARRVVRDIRDAASARRRAVGIMMDTQGPAIRTGDLPAALDLQPGQTFTLTVRGQQSEELHS